MERYYLQPASRVKVARRLKRVLRFTKNVTVSPAVLSNLKEGLKQASRKGSFSLDEDSFDWAVGLMLRRRIITKKEYAAIVAMAG